MRKIKRIDFNYINRVMKYKVDESVDKLIYITNKKEVLRISKDKAQSKLKFKKLRINKWQYTTKAAYSQYIESRKKKSKIKKPKFKIKGIDSNLKYITIPIHLYKRTN